MTRHLTMAVLTALVLSGCPPKQTSPTPAGDDAAAGATGADGSATTTQPDEPPERRLERTVNEAIRAIESKDLAKIRGSLEELKALSADVPDRAEIPFNIGVAYEALGDDLNARKSYLRATDIDPTLGAAWLNLGALAEESGDLSRALQSYEAGLRYDPENPDLIVGVIGVLRKQGKYNQAIDRAKQALGQNANNLAAYNNLGLVYLEQGQVDLANFVYQKALNSIEGADKNAYLHCNLGRVYLAQDQSFLARQELTRALELDPDLVAAMLFLAGEHLDDHNWEDAATLLERARGLESGNPAILVNLGIAYRGLGRFEEAQALYQQALELDPDNADPYLNLAVLQGDHMRAYDAALASIDRYLAAGGKQTELAAQWRAELETSKDKYEREQARRAKREEREAKRKEEERLAAEYEAMQAEKRAAADKALGKSCPKNGCPDLTACNRDNVCAEPGSPGTAAVGETCAADTDCTYGTLCGPELTCIEGSALDGGASGSAPAGDAPAGDAPAGDSPWGEVPTDDTPDAGQATGAEGE